MRRASAVLALALGLLAVSSARSRGATPPDGWRIRLEASLPGVVDQGRLTLGASTAALDGYDEFDDPHPPAWPGRFLDLVTVHAQDQPGWEDQPLASVRYRAQFDTPLGPGSRILPFVMETDESGTATLTWAMGTDLDLAQHFATLRDVETGATVDMWAEFSYSFAASPGAHRFQVELTGGRSAPPIAHDQAVSTAEDASLPITLTATDAENDPLTFSVVSAAAHGTLVGVAPDLVYTPDRDYHGPDRFTFRATDGTTVSNVATVDIAVTPVNDAPLATAQSVTTDEETPLAILLSGTDVDGDALVFGVSTGPAHGTVSGTPPQVTYTPAADFSGTDSFTFRANDGLLLSAAATVSITVQPVNDPPVADFSVPGPARSASTAESNLGSIFEGAGIAAFSSQLNTSFPPGNALDESPGTRWASAQGQIADQFITVALPGSAPRPVQRFRLHNGDGTGGQSVKRFEVRLSTTTPDEAAFTTVLSDIALDNARIQEFVLPAPVPARFVQFRAKDNYGSTCCVSIKTFEVVDPGLAGVPSYSALPANVALLSEGARVVSVTSANPSLPGAQLIDGINTTRWASANLQPANQTVVIELAREKTYAVDRLRLLNGHGTGGQAMRDFRIGVSDTTTDPAAFTTVFTGAAADLTTFQEFVFPGGAASARYVRLEALNNHGSACCISLYEVQVPPVGGPLPSFSSYQDASNRPENALDANVNTAWITASGQVANQFLKVRLDGGEPLLDRVRLQGWSSANNEALRDFDVLLSSTTDDDAAFAPAVSGTVLNNGQLQEFVFPGGPVRARYLKLAARNNHGSTGALRLATLEAVTVGSEGNIVSLPGTALNVVHNQSPAQIAGGATVVRFSSAATQGQAPAAMLDYVLGLPWRTTAVAGQYAVIQLGGGQSWTVEAVSLSGRLDCCPVESVKDFEVWLSNTTDDDAAFALALSGSVANDGTLQTFALPVPTAARFVKYVPLTNHGPATGIATSFFDLRAREAGGVVSATSQASFAQRPELAVDGNTATVWQTATGAAANQSVRLSLDGGLLRTLYGVRIHTFSNIGPRDFEVRASSTTADDGAFATVLAGTLPVGDALREVLFPQLAQARYLQFLWKNGHSASSIGVRELEVLEVPAAGAVVVATTSQNAESQSPRFAIDFDRGNTGWITANGQAVNQSFTLLLPQADTWLVDQVALQPRTDCCDAQSPRDFEVQVSAAGAEDAAFQTVLAGTLRNDRALQFFRFPAVPARYVRLLVRNTYGGTQVMLGTFWVISPELGGPTVRFLDRSTDPDGAVGAFSWQFGDGGASSARDPQHTYAGPGTYMVSLTATDDGGAFTTRTRRYRVFGAPVADFTFNPALPNEGQNVGFLDVSQDPFGPAVVRDWDWGDGTSHGVNQANLTHAFADDGAYPVTLRIANARGIAGAVTKVVTVANVAPTANAGPDRTVPWGVNWNTSSGVSDPSSTDLATLSCTWDFGDGQQATVSPCNNSTVRVAHPYALPGAYTATLTVTDNDGASDGDSAVVTVTRHATALSLCAPQIGTPRDSLEVEVTATLTDTSVPGASMAGQVVAFTVGGQTTEALTDQNGVARLLVTVPADGQAAVTAVFAEGTFYAGSTASGTVRVGSTAASSSRDSQGTEFWLGFPGNLGTPELSLFVTGGTDTTGTVRIPALNFCQSFSVTANQVTTVVVPAAATMDTSEAIEAKGIHLTALKDVTVYGLNRLTFTTDAYLGLPLDILGTDYVSLGYRNSNIVNATQFGLVATADDTTVTIRPSVTTGAHPAGVPYDVVLDRGQSYLLRNTSASPADLSGTLVSSDKPVALFGSHQCANVPGGVTFCDHIVEQIPPPDTWGRSFVTMPLATRLNGDTFRFVASVDGTSVQVNGAPVATLNRGQVHERIIAGPAQIVADQPILVAQYSNGTSYDGVTSDPFMMLIPPFEQFLSAYTVSTPATGFPINFVNVVAPTSAVGAITRDGAVVPASSFVPIGTSGFSGAQLTVGAGSHRLAGPAPFGVFVYGFASFDSYGYAGGMSLAPVARVATVTLTPEAETSMVGVERCVVAAVADQDGQPLEDVRVDFTVAGPHVRTGFGATDGAGEVPFCYTGTTAGLDVITASVGSVSDTATKTWVSNQGPVAADQHVVTDEDTPVAVTLGATDPDGDPLTFTVVDVPAHGTLSGTPPDLTYAPAAEFGGADSFTFRASDGEVDSNLATVTIEVRAVNDAPVAEGQQVSTPEDTPFALVLGAVDIEGDALTYAIVEGPAHGTLSGTPPDVTYTPAAHFHGEDAFSFRANDGDADSNVAVVAVTVTPVNDAPTAADQALTTPEDVALPVTLGATDPDGDALAFTVVDVPAHGTLSGAPPDLLYTPAAHFHGEDRFTFKASDGQADSNLATVAITVTPVNDAPRADDQSVSTPEDTPLPVTLTAADVDGDVLAFTVVGAPAHGQLGGTPPLLTYTPGPNFNGVDHITFQAADGQAESNVATVTITVTPVDDPPVALDQSLATPEDTPLPVTLTAVEVDGDALAFTVVGGPTHGSLAGTPPSLVYTPDPDYHGPDAIVFKANDGHSDSNLATVAITVTPVNDPPGCDAATVDAGTLWPPNHAMVDAQVLGVGDVDGDPVTVQATAVRQDEPVNGNGDGNTSPDATLSPLRVRRERSGQGDGRVYHVTFQGSDGRGGTCTGTVTVCVPHDQSPPTCGDGGPLFDSTQP